LLRDRPRFVADCLEEAGDAWHVLKHLIALMAGVGRASAVPSALVSLRNAIAKMPADFLSDGNVIWDAETICQVAVHDHRQVLLRDVNLRRATLDVLDRLIESGSSLAFQLRDYLATSSPLISPESQSRG
jgi:hypothetical protein